MRKHHFNQQFFDTINTESQAYWLGFLTADGSVQYTNKNKSVSLGLATKDASHLEKFAENLNYTGPILRATGKATLNLYSKHMVESLMALGITPRKTFTVKAWNGPTHLQHHYWRGVFDGDGGFFHGIKIRKTKAPYHAWSASIVGTFSIVQGFKKFMLKNGEPPYNKGTIRKNGSVWTIGFGGLRPCQNIVKELYSDSTVFLDRKKETSNTVLSQQLQDPIIQHLTPDILVPLYERFQNWSLVAKELNVSHNGMYKHARKLGLKRRVWQHK